MKYNIFYKYIVVNYTYITVHHTSRAVFSYTFYNAIHMTI